MRTILHRMKHYFFSLILIALFGFFGISALSSNTAASQHPQRGKPIVPSTSKYITPVTEWSCTKNPEIAFFMYHYIRDDEPADNKMTRNLSVTPQNFESHMQTVAELAKSWKITLMKWDDLVQAMKMNCFPGKKIWIFTSDDGWVDSADYLAPIAAKHQVPFIFGIISGKVGTKGFVSKGQLQAIANNPLFTVASHSITHRAMSTIDKKDEKQEICESKAELEKMTGKKVQTFIYPTGKIGKWSTKYLKECGYDLAWSTGFGRELNWQKPQLLVMNRTRISHDTTAEFYKKLVK